MQFWWKIVLIQQDPVGGTKLHFSFVCSLSNWLLETQLFIPLQRLCVCGCVCVLCVRLSWVSYNSMNISQNSQHWKWGLEYQTMLYLHKIQFLYFFYFFCCRQKTKDKKNLHQIYTQISFQIKKGTLHSPLENQVIHISHRVHKIRLEVTEWQNRLLLYCH